MTNLRDRRSGLGTTAARIMARDRRFLAGFTLIEMLVTVTVAAILIGMATPMVRDLKRSTAVSTATSGFLSALHLTRSEAIKRGRRVTICTSEDQESCATTGDWTQGWIIFADADGDGARDATEPIVQAVQRPFADTTVQGNGPVRSYVSYTPLGGARKTGGALQMGTIAVCRDGRAQGIVLSASGRPRVDRELACSAACRCFGAD